MVAVTVDLARYRAIVHYTDCSYYKTTHTHATLQVPPSVKWKLCSFCKPVREDIAAIAYDIRWVPKNADAMSFRFTSFDTDREKMALQLSSDASLNGGRKVKTNMLFRDR